MRASQEVLNEVYDLFIDLDAHRGSARFPVIYSNARSRHCEANSMDESEDLRPLFEAILKHIPRPAGDPDGVLQMLVANLDYSDYLGPSRDRPRFQRHAAARRRSRHREAATAALQNTKITKLYSFEGLKRVDETIGGPATSWQSPA